jgi:hypothetical protein
MSGICDYSWGTLLGVCVPWITGAIVNHLQIYAHLVNWTALITTMYV